MKRTILFLLIAFQSVSGQKTLEQIIDETPFSTTYYSSFTYYDSAEKKQGISIQNEANILKKLEVKNTAELIKKAAKLNLI